MANKKIKGLTVEIGGDTTKLGKALEAVDKKSNNLSSELGEINRLLRFDPGNVDLLAQKQKVLADAVANTKEKLDTLKKAEAQVQKQFERGEVSEEQVRALQREIVVTEGKLNSYKNAVKETADEVANLGKNSEDTSDKMAGVLGGGLKAAGAGMAALGAGAVASAESTREYRTEMGKLDAAYAASGYSSEAAANAYKTLQGIIGETDQSVEAAQQIALLADSEEQVAKWAGLASGVVGVFGDALQPETFFEAANETMKLGEATGAYVQMLEGTGLNVDEFNEGLAKCNTEAEKQAYMLKVTEGALGAAGTAYEANNADVIAANAANEQWTASLAEVGAKVEPLLTKLKEIGATMLSMVVPVIDAVVDNLPMIAVGITGVTAAMVAFKIAAIAATAAQKGMTLAQYAAAAAQGVLNAVMSANPIGLIILGITALVVAVMAMVKHWEGFAEFFKGLWEGIKNVFSKVVNFIKDNWKTMLLFLTNPLAGVFKYCYDHFEGFRNFVNKALSSIKKGFESFVNTLKALPSKIWSAIVGAVNRVKQWGTNLVNSAKTAAANMLNNVTRTLSALPGKVWGAIKGAISRVAQWGSDMVNRAKTSVTNLVTSVVNKLKELPGKVVSIGKDLVSGLWNGVRDKLNWLKSKLSGFADSVLSGIKSFFGVHSPSTETAWVGEMLDEGFAKGIEANADSPLKAMDKLSSRMLGEAEVLDIPTIERRMRHTFGSDPATSQMGGMLSKLDQIYQAILSGQVIMLDGKTLVGSTADRYDSELGQRRVLAERGAL